MGDLFFEIIVSVMLVSLGIISIFRKKIAIGIGRPPIFDVELSGGRAILFGCVSLIAGLIPVAIMVYNYAAPDKAIEQGTLGFVQGVGIAVTFITFTFELFIEFLVALQNRAGKKD